jgi:hypothetical protein
MANFSFNNQTSGSAYFTYETVRSTGGFYDSSSLKAASGSFSNFTSSNDSYIVQSDYIWGTVVPKGVSGFDFTPSLTVPTGSVRFRGTGELTVTITT